MKQYIPKSDDRPVRTSHYLNNDDFKAALEEYRLAREASPDNLPRVPEYVGECIVLIATNMARRPNFAGYSWRDDMIGDAIETCLKYVDRFDTQRGTSALAYFSQIVWFSFLGRIAVEKKQSKIKREMVRYAGVDTFALQDHDETGEFTVNLQEFLSGIGDDEVVATPPKKESISKPSFFDGFTE